MYYKLKPFLTNQFTMELDPILSALTKLEQPINNGYNDLNDKYQLVYAQLDAMNMTGSKKNG